MKPLVIYHGNCVDGFTAAWVMARFYGFADVDLHPGVYGEDPPDVTNRHVVVVDFSYPRAVLDGMHSRARSVVVLDHHKTAQEALAGLPEPPGSAAEWGRLVTGEGPIDYRPYALFDMDRSGAGLAWDWCFPEEDRPVLVSSVQDYDLWRFRLRGTRSLHEWIASFDYTLDDWSKIRAALNTSSGYESALTEAAAIERSRDKLARSLIELGRRPFCIGGYLVPTVNAPPQLASSIGHILSEEEHFAATYVDQAEWRVFSLRSSLAGFDVGVIAKGYGGGGHKHAAGFRMPLGWSGDA